MPQEQIIFPDDDNFRGGTYDDSPNAIFYPFEGLGRTLKYALTNQNISSVWTEYTPTITESGRYELFVWIPTEHATTRMARYHIHGVVGHEAPVVIPVKQADFNNEWVSLGVYELDANAERPGRVHLNNLTYVPDEQIAFTPLKWVQLVTEPLADGFSSPVGIETSSELDDEGLWVENMSAFRPDEWYVTVEYNQRYTDGAGNPAIHTGVDLNLNPIGAWNKDAGQPVYAIASGEVTFAEFVPRYWGNIVIIKHDPLVPGGPYVYSRSAHLGEITVQEGDRVERGQKIGTVGSNTNRAGQPIRYNEHLHFDISPSDVLLDNPTNWPGMNRQLVERNYLDPRPFIAANRPK